MACNEALVQRVREFLAGRPGQTERRMFGGVCFLHRGHMACGVSGDDLMLRIGPLRAAEALTQPHVREMDFTGKPMKGYVFVAAEGLATDADLRYWVELTQTFTAALPTKVDKPSPPR